MVTVNGVDEVKKLLSEFPNQIPFAAKEALNSTAFIVRRDLKSNMDKVFDRPTPFVKKGLWVTKATKTNLSVKIWMNENNNGYYDSDDTLVNIIKPHIFGGVRRTKGFEATLWRKGILKTGEWLVPGRSVPRNRYGNVTRGLVQKITSQIGGYSDVGSTQNATTDPSRRQYIFGQIGDTKAIWKVDRRNNKWIPYFIVVKGKPRYKKRFAYFEVATDSFNKNIINEVGKAVDKALSTMK